MNLVQIFAIGLLVVGCSTPNPGEEPKGALCDTLQACGCPSPPCVVTEPTHTQAHTVAPSASMPEGVVSQTAHNNLDIVWHHGRIFVAFRTAPIQIVDPKLSGIFGRCRPRSPEDGLHATFANLRLLGFWYFHGRREALATRGWPGTTLRRAVVVRACARPFWLGSP